jgi:hypothetical protein|tara:strand:- start:125 stop:340 length:216 start_codon:yes stop_codon:yes gene_type:complete
MIARINQLALAAIFALLVGIAITGASCGAEEECVGEDFVRADGERLSPCDDDDSSSDDDDSAVANDDDSAE